MSKPTPEPKKQVSIFFPLSQWQLIRLEAARRKIPIAQLCREWMQSDVDKLTRQT